MPSPPRWSVDESSGLSLTRSVATSSVISANVDSDCCFLVLGYKSLLFGIMVFQSAETPSCYQGNVSEEETNLHNALSKLLLKFYTFTFTFLL